MVEIALCMSLAVVTDCMNLSMNCMHSCFLRGVSMPGLQVLGDPVDSREDRPLFAQLTVF